MAGEPEPADQAADAPETPNREAEAEQAAHASQPADDAPTQEAMRASEADFEPWEHDEAAKAAAEHDAGKSSGTDDRSAP